MATVDFRCVCGKQMRFKAEHAGKKTRCPDCEATIIVPHREDEDVEKYEEYEDEGDEHAVATVKRTGSRVRGSENHGQISREILRDANEGTAFGWLVFFSIICWLVLTLWIVLSLGLVLFFIGMIALARHFAELFAVAYIKTNAVEVSERQFPEIYSIADSFASRLDEPLPTIYVLQENVWNAFAMKIAGKKLVVLLSGAIDSLLLKGSLSQLAFVIGHELGHHYAGHLDFWRHTTVQFGSWFVWVRLWYNRRCELTCDRYGLACANSLTECQRAVCNMAVGAQLASEVDIDQAIAQWQRHRSEFFVKYRTLYSTHPHTLWRLKELQESAEELEIPA